MLTTYCQERASRGFPITQEGLLDEVQKILTEVGRDTIFENNRPHTAFWPSISK